MRKVYLFNMSDRIGHIFMEPFIVRNTLGEDIIFGLDPDQKIINHSAIDFVSRDFPFRKMSNFSEIFKEFFRHYHYNKKPLEAVLNGETISIVGSSPYIPHLINSLHKKHPDVSTVKYFSLNEEDYIRGQELERYLGIPKGAKFITLHIREGNFLSSYVDASKDWSHHDIRDCTVDYLYPTIDFLLQEGYWVIRIGDPGSTPLPAHYRTKQVIDLPHTHQSLVFGFADIWFCTQCAFMLTSGSGPVAIAHTSGSTYPPIVTFNQIPIYTPLSIYRAHDIFTPKLIYSEKRKRILSYEEMRILAIDKFSTTQQYAEAGLSVIENSKEDILSAAKEMINHLRGKDIPLSENTLRFLKIAKYHHDLKSILGEYDCDFRLRIAQSFIEHHPEFIV